MTMCLMRQAWFNSGLINCHHHFYQTLTRALPAALNKELFPWLESLYPVGQLTEESAVPLPEQLFVSFCCLAAPRRLITITFFQKRLAEP